MSSWLFTSLFVLGLVAAWLVIIYGLVLLLVLFVAGGNWLSEENRYVRWRHYAGVKLKLLKPMPHNHPNYKKVAKP